MTGLVEASSPRASRVKNYFNFARNSFNNTTVSDLKKNFPDFPLNLKNIFFPDH